jgi:hypothetical protein
MDGLIPHLLTKLDQAHDLLRDIKEIQSDHSEVLDRIENKEFCRSGSGPAFEWQKIVPTLIWGAVLLGLLVLQIPLKDAISTVTKLSGGL